MDVGASFLQSWLQMSSFWSFGSLGSVAIKRPIELSALVCADCIFAVGTTEEIPTRVAIKQSVSMTPKICRPLVVGLVGGAAKAGSPGSGDFQLFSSVHSMVSSIIDAALCFGRGSPSPSSSSKATTVTMTATSSRSFTIFWYGGVAAAAAVTIRSRPRATRSGRQCLVITLTPRPGRQGAQVHCLVVPPGWPGAAGGAGAWSVPSLA